MKNHKTGFISSQRCPASVVLKSYDWAKAQRQQSKCIICSNHSQIEKDVFEILLRGKQPLILVLPRSMKKRWESDIENAVNDNRLLVISPFGNDIHNRVTRETARFKNQTIIELSDEIVVGYKTPGGQLDELLFGAQFSLL